MSSERSLWNQVRDKLSPFGKLKRVENRVDLGFPDVVYNLALRKSPPVTGFLELKYEHAWPTRRDTPVRIESLKLEQVRWMEDWVDEGRGHGWFLLQIERDYMLLRPSVMLALYHQMHCKQSLVVEADLGWSGEWPLARILGVLTQ